MIAPSIDSQLQSIPSSLSYANKPRCQNSQNTPASVHSMNRLCADELLQMPVALSAFHWQPVRSTKKMASIASRSGTRGLWQPSGCFGRAGSNGSSCFHNRSGIRQPSSLVMSPMTTPSTRYLHHGKVFDIKFRWTHMDLPAYRDRLLG